MFSPSLRRRNYVFALAIIVVSFSLSTSVFAQQLEERGDDAKVAGSVNGVEGVGKKREVDPRWLSYLDRDRAEETKLRYQKLFLVSRLLYPSNVADYQEISSELRRLDRLESQLESRRNGRYNGGQAAVGSLNRGGGSGSKQPSVTSVFELERGLAWNVLNRVRAAENELNGEGEPSRHGLGGRLADNDASKTGLKAGKSDVDRQNPNLQDQSEELILALTQTEIKDNLPDLIGGRQRNVGRRLEDVIAEMAAEVPEIRRRRLESYGEPDIDIPTDLGNGKKTYDVYCSTCHGVDGSGPPEEHNHEGRGIGPYGSKHPFIYLPVYPLTRNHAGGKTPQFSERAAYGLHATIPDMTPASVLSHQAWADLQAYVVSIAKESVEATPK